MERSDTIAKVAAAIAGAQSDLHNVVADSENPHFRSKYTSLGALLDVVRPVLTKHGLALLQFPITEGTYGAVGVETTLLHASGEYLSERFTVIPAKQDPQGAGGAITYCRRYGLAAVLLIGQEDDDGNTASRGTSRREASPRRDDRGVEGVLPEGPASPSAPPRGPVASPSPSGGEAGPFEDRGTEAAPAGETLPWIDEPLGFGGARTHDGKRTWREMLTKHVEDTNKGERSFLTWLSQAGTSNPRQEERKARASACLAELF